MATLALGAVGTLLGGPIGGAIGALAGRQIDSAVLGSPSTEGPRLAELAVTTSSYGQPIPRHFGTVRAPGVVFWATDLVESSETTGGGKGRPDTTSYSYSISFAVAVSSTPIEGIGRIWADGNLLRGANGDLKVPGSIRIYNGHGDQETDPLIEAAQNDAAPGMRGCAHIVFEDLALADFGNRIPTLSFEVVERTGSHFGLADLVGQTSIDAQNGTFGDFEGYSDNGGGTGSLLRTIDRLVPLTSRLNGRNLVVSFRSNNILDAAPLPARLATNEGDEGKTTNGPRRSRLDASDKGVAGLRYYDPDRDYQVSLQRADRIEQSIQDDIIELPATTRATKAKQLCDAVVHRHTWSQDRISLQIAELSGDLAAGAMVSLEDHPGIWRALNWEWMDRGVTLELERVCPAESHVGSADAGTFSQPSDLALGPTNIWVISVPPIDSSSASRASYFAAMNGSEGWSGSTLHVDLDGSLSPLNLFSRRTATVGHLVSDLRPSKSTILERGAALELDLVGNGAAFQSATINALSAGSNRLYLGGEILQFVEAQQTGENRWRLCGLLRGRAGTEHISHDVQPAGALAILLDSNLIELGADLLHGATKVAATGTGDSLPSIADLPGKNMSATPLSPVHPRFTEYADGTLRLSWTRRARGAWLWLDNVQAPLIEEREDYIVGYGSVSAPYKTWNLFEADLALSAGEISSLISQFGPAPFWVKQVGTFATSPAKHLFAFQ
ncbi:hypothetical protein BPTFM16_01960 [Altererythrobacter insulae]|nr:hypothetical protein BPTFM16_01960 [Altererythrobacter insulae]